ncbi:MAG: NosD domain-containing protein [Candidatus Bathyarchaeia archaeon]|jgi:parallel beta-helix repeat protein
MIYINADGSITPSTFPILTFDNVTYWFTGNILNESIIVQRNNVVLEGLDHTLQGDGTGNGIYLSGMVNVTIRDFIVEDFDNGIWFSGSSGSTILADVITSDNHGIRLDSLSNNNLVSGNSVTNNTVGILVESSSNNNVSGNTVTNDQAGIQIEDSSYSTVSANNVVSNSNRGILLLSSSNTAVFGNTLTGNYYGVDLESSSGNIVSGNSIVDNSFGLTLSHSNGNTVFENNITQSYIGLGFYSSSGDTVFGNTITINDRGVFIQSSSNNVVYHNNFVNILQVMEEDNRGAWDRSYPSGGNYWSDYTGVDVESGPNQDQSGSDGIGDTAYVIDNNNTDHYPLMMPWTPYSHDVAVTSVVPAKTIIAGGFSGNVTVTVANFGQNAETFNVTAYANPVMIGTQLVVNLSQASTTTLTLTWNTTAPVLGNYTLSAYAWPVSGETYTADNNVTGGAVQVTIPGDLNGDFRVNVQDLIILALAYGTKPGDQKWDPNADINGDNSVGPSDLAILVNHYGQPHPP